MMRTATVWLVLGSVLFGNTSPAAAQPELNEHVIRVPVMRAGTQVELETTLYLPEGSGPFPLAVINHGKSFGNPRQQHRARFAVLAAELVRRGYVVALPMRQGFSKSGGVYVDTLCDYEQNGLMQAQDIAGAIRFLQRNALVDADRIVVMGVSHGGLATLALGTLQVGGVRGLVNFSGGLLHPSCADWPNQLVWTVTRYGRTTRVPSLWVYSENDSHFPPHLVEQMHARYTAVGGQAAILHLGRFRQDGHDLYSSREALAMWMPAMLRFLESIGLPH